MGRLTWSNNYEFTMETTLEDAIQLSGRGQDNGFIGAVIIMPKTDDCASWISFYGYLNHVDQRNRNK